MAVGDGDCSEAVLPDVLVTDGDVTGLVAEEAWVEVAVGLEARVVLSKLAPAVMMHRLF